MTDRPLPLATLLLLVPAAASCATGRSADDPAEWREWAASVRSGEHRPGSSTAYVPARSPRRGATTELYSSAMIGPQGASDDLANRSVSAALSRATIPGLVVEEEESLRAVAEQVKAMSGVPIVVHPLAEDAAIDEGAVFDFSMTHPLTVRDALNIIARTAGPEVSWTVKHETVLFTTQEKARGETVLWNHDIRNLITGRTDFMAPRIDRIRLLDDMEDDDGGGPFGGIGEVHIPMDGDEIATLIQESIAPDSWDEEGVSITAENGFVLVRHTLEVQWQIQRLLHALGA